MHVCMYVCMVHFLARCHSLLRHLTGQSTILSQGCACMYVVYMYATFIRGIHASTCTFKVRTSENALPRRRSSLRRATHAYLDFLFITPAKQILLLNTSTPCILS